MNTLVVGIDGGEWDVLDTMIDAGQLPNIARLNRQGVSGPLNSVTPPVSPPAWNTIQTGTNPGKHGVYDFNVFDEQYDRRAVNSTDRSATPLWEIMNDEGIETGLFKIPFTYPPGDVDGFMVAGFPTPKVVDDYVTPESIVDRVGPVENLFEDWSLQNAGEYEAFKRNLINIAERQTDLFVDLLREYDTDFAMTVYDGSDRIQHFFWKYFDESHLRYEPDSPLTGAIKEYYMTVDRGIGRLLEEADDGCNVVILSDHGFGPLTHDIYIEEWLEQEGFLARQTEGSGEYSLKDLLVTVLEVGWNVAKRFKLEGVVRSVLPSSWFRAGSDLQVQAYDDIDWNQSKAFFTAQSGQSLFVNLEDRFASGVVSKDRYDEIVEELRESLLSIEHPETGEALIEAVHRSDEVYHGWAVDNAPDLIVRTDPEYTLKRGRSDSLVQASTHKDNDRSGDHRADGILIAKGPAFGTGTVEDASVVDIAPTLLYLQDVPIPSSMDGGVLTGLLSESILDNRNPQETTDYGRSETDRRNWNSREKAEIEDRLSDMGYLN